MAGTISWVEVILPVLEAPGIAQLWEGLTAVLAAGPRTQVSFDLRVGVLRCRMLATREGDVDLLIAPKTGSWVT